MLATRQPVTRGTRRFVRIVCAIAAAVLPLHFLAADEPLAESGIDWNSAREFWSFQLPHAQPLPQVRNQRWARQRMDSFILAAMEARHLSPSPEANRRVLIRRVTFDLTGLPPTPEEVEAFLEDRSVGAYANVVARLLESPRFGEHLASLWMNVARYAEDQAHQVGDDVKGFYPNAWRYREWVVNAFNRDLPYDQFIRLQLAADSLGGGAPIAPIAPKATTATDDLAALGFIGLGPKYYNRDRLDVMADEWEDRVDTVARSFLGLTVACARCHDHKFDPITMRDYYGMAGVFASTRLVNKNPLATEEPSPEKSGKDQGKGNPEKPTIDPSMLHMVEDGKPQDLNVFIRGNVDRKGPVVERRFLQILCAGNPTAFTHGSGRVDLANAIASTKNPLTARVIVNRLWGMMFGRGLVGTPSNFGKQGQPPTHPELLDDLAVRFMENGWSIKSLVREMALSATYRQRSDVTARSRSHDADNRFLSHMNRRRLTVEMWRDGILAVSGRLDLTGGNSMEVDDPLNVHRTLYSRISRLKLNDVLMQFDYPDANVHAEKRSVTTTATQKLFMLNSPFMLAQARALAERLTTNPGLSNRDRVKTAYQLLYSRPVTDSEMRLALQFLGREENPDMPRWEQYAQALLSANEMMYVD